ncbi:MAG: HvfC/BufC N-terminal domain-containing protein [Bacteroidia bacterium]
MSELLKKDTKEIQSKLADYCRTGELSLTTEVNQKHVHHYRRLVYNIIDDILESAFPIFFEFATGEMWDEMVNDFFSNHNCQTPQVWKLPGEFYEYAIEKDWAEKYKLPFLEDLLLFEWIEMDIHTMKDEVFPECKEEGDWLKDVVVLNPEYRILQTKYPVHITAPVNITEGNAGHYFILIFRQPETGNVQFLDISVLYALAIEKIEEEKTLPLMVDELQTTFSFPDKKVAQDHIITFLEDLKHKGFVSGFKK